MFSKYQMLHFNQNELQTLVTKQDMNKFEILSEITAVICINRRIQENSSKKLSTYKKNSKIMREEPEDYQSYTQKFISEGINFYFEYLY